MFVPALFVGQSERAEFQRVLKELQTAGPLSFAGDLGAARGALQQPSLRRVWLAPTYRDEFPRDEVARLVQVSPLAEFYVLVGPWIEGETRSGQPCIAAPRLYLHQIVPWLRAERWAVDSGSAPASRWQPMTLSPEEASQSAARRPWPGSTGGVLVCSELAETRRTLLAVCAAAGFRSLAIDPNDRLEGADFPAVIYDAVGNRGRWIDHVIELKRRYQPRRLVVLANFPRANEADAFFQSGATEVVGKPFPLDVLLAALTATPPQIRVA